MKNFTFALLFSIALAASAAASVKVACVGDSITYGDGIRDRAKDSYPVQLAKILGDEYKVENFGVCGATAISYTHTKQYVQSKEFAPDIVVLKFGTNDANPKNWDKSGKAVSYEADMNALIDSYANLASRPRIYLCLPAPTFSGARAAQTRTLAKYIRPLILKIALERGLGVIDTFSLLEGRHELFPDNLHPNPEGAKMMAELIGAAIKK